MLMGALRQMDGNQGETKRRSSSPRGGQRGVAFWSDESRREVGVIEVNTVNEMWGAGG